MLNNIIFRLDDEDANGAHAWAHILRRHLAFFGDEQCLTGLLEWIGKENPYYELLLQLESTFVPEAPRQPFQDLDFVEEGFWDLVGRMTKLDPSKRITAKEARQHSWFSACHE